MSALPRVCVVGSLNMDLVVRAPRLPLAGETILGSTYRAFPGGKGANQAVAARRMGAAVSLVGCIGDDPHGAKLRATLEAEEIDLSHVATRAGEATGLALITVAEGGENTIVVSPGVNALLSAEDVHKAREAISGADVLLMQLEIANAAIAAALGIAKESKRAVILNAAPARVLTGDVLRQLDAVVVNRAEGARLLGMDPSPDPARLALRLPDLGAPTVILTLGANGVILTHRGRTKRYPSPVVQATDGTGAGDAFCGCLAAAWPGVHGAVPRSNDEFARIEKAVMLAAVAGALATTRAGAMPSMPREEEVRALAAKGA